MITPQQATQELQALGGSPNNSAAANAGSVHRRSLYDIAFGKGQVAGKVPFFFWINVWGMDPYETMLTQAQLGTLNPMVIRLPSPEDLGLTSDPFPIPTASSDQNQALKIG